MPEPSRHSVGSYHGLALVRRQPVANVLTSEYIFCCGVVKQNHGWLITISLGCNSQLRDQCSVGVTGSRAGLRNQSFRG